MFILLIFAFLSGLVTIFSPCIWPVLPIIFSFSVSTPNKNRSLSLTLGIITSFTVLTLTLSLLVRSLGINPNLFRYFAVFIIIFFGLSLIVPTLRHKVEAFISRIFRFNSSSHASGFITGLSLGALWTPCAGPILATVVTLAAAGKVTATTIFITLSYVIGVAIPLFIFSFGGQKIFSRLHLTASATPKIQKVFGVVMIATAVLLFFNINLPIQFMNNISLNPDNNPIVQQQLSSLKGNPALLTQSSPAPDFTGGGNWLNSSTLKLSDLKGKVVLVDFWTYTCINCIRTLPHLNAWYQKYASQGLIIVGVHTPEFEFEKDTANVTKAISDFKIKYPVVQDNNYAIWNDYQNQYWPAEYLIDSTGKIRRSTFGEGEYDQTEMAIQSLLADSGRQINTPLDSQPDTAPKSRISPESYLGSSRAEYYYPNSTITPGTANFTLAPNIPVNSFSLGGTWNITTDEAVTNINSTLIYHFFASKVFLVLRPAAGQKSLVNVYIDNKLTNQITIDSDRLYTLFDQSGPPSDHVLKLEFLTPGTQAFAFTFG